MKSPKKSNSAKRKVGFYWVKFSEDNNANFSNREWVPAYWDGQNWWIIGATSPAQLEEGTDIRKVGYKIGASRHMKAKKP